MSETRVTVDSVEPFITPDVDVLVVGALNAEDVKKGLESVLNVAGWVAGFSNNATVTLVLAKLKSLSEQQWFIDLIVGVSELFDKGDNSQAMKLIEAQVASQLTPSDVADSLFVAGSINVDDVTRAVDGLVRTVTAIGSLTGNASVVKAASVIGAIVSQPWFARFIVNTLS